MAEERNEAVENLTEVETKIIENLKYLNEFAGRENFNSMELKKATQVVVETLDWIAESVESTEINLPMQVLELLEHLDMKVDFSNRLGDSMISFMIAYNQSTCNQMIWEMEKSGVYLEKSIDFLKRMIAEREKRRTKEYKKSAELIKLRFLLVKAYLQNAAILSQRAIHEVALKNALEAKNELKLLATRMLEISKEKKILEGRKLEEFMKSQLPKYLETFVDEVRNRDPTEKQGEDNIKENESKKNGIIFWKHNFENNEIYLKKELSNRFGDVFEEEKLTTVWLEDFNIGNIMHLTAINYHMLDPDYCKIQEVFHNEYIIEIFLVYACCLFSIATENRFICHKSLEKKNAKKSTVRNPEGQDAQQETEFSGPIDHITKNYHLQQNENFQQSEVYHFKAIQILCLFVEECPLLEHFKGSYHKNYSPDLAIIPEEEEHKKMNESMMSLKSTATEEYQQRKILNRSVIYKERESARMNSKSKEFIDFLKAKYYRNEMRESAGKEDLNLEQLEKEKLRIEKDQIERDKKYQRILFQNKFNSDEREKRNKSKKILNGFDFSKKTSEKKNSDNLRLKFEKQFSEEEEEDILRTVKIKPDRDFNKMDLSHSSNGKTNTKETKDKSSYEKEDISLKSQEEEKRNGLKTLCENIVISSYKGSPFSTPIPQERDIRKSSEKKSSKKKFTIENLQISEEISHSKKKADTQLLVKPLSSDKKLKNLYKMLYCDEKIEQSPQIMKQPKQEPKKKILNDRKIQYDYIKKKIAGVKKKDLLLKKNMKKKKKSKSPLKSQKKRTSNVLSNQPTSKLLSSLKSKHALKKAKNEPKKQSCQNMFSCNELKMKDFIKMHRDSDNQLRTITKKVFMKTKEKRLQNKNILSSDTESFMRKMKPSYLKIIKKNSKSTKRKSKKKLSSAKFSKKSMSPPGKRSLSKKRSQKKTIFTARTNSKKSHGLKLRKYSHKVIRRSSKNKSSLMLQRQNATFNKFISKTPRIKTSLYNRAISERSKKSPISSRKISTQRKGQKGKGFKLDLSNLKKFKRKKSHEKKISEIYGKRGKHQSKSPLKNDIMVKTKRSFSTKERNLRNLNVFSKEKKLNSTTKAGYLKSIPQDSLSLLSSLNQVDISSLSNQRMRGYQKKEDFTKKKNKYFNNLIKNMHSKKKEKEKPQKLASIYSSSNSRLNLNYPYTERACYSKAFTFKKTELKNLKNDKHSVKNSLKKHFKRKISAHTFFKDRKNSNISNYGGNSVLRDNIRNLLERKLSKSKDNKSKDKKPKLFDRKRSNIMGGHMKEKKLNRSSTSRLLGKGFTSDRVIYF